MEWGSRVVIAGESLLRCGPVLSSKDVGERQGGSWRQWWGNCGDVRVSDATALESGWMDKLPERLRQVHTPSEASVDF